MTTKRDIVGIITLPVGLIIFNTWGRDSFNRVFDVNVETLLSLGPVVVGLGLGWMIVGRTGVKRDIAIAMMIIAGVIYVLISGVGVVNQYLDQSSAKLEPGVYLKHHKPSKGSPFATLSWRGAEHKGEYDWVSKCEPGQAVTVSVRQGALGLAWIERVECVAK